MQTQEVKNKYNEDIPNKFGGEYEFNRWFKTDILKAGYDMTKSAILSHFVNDSLSFSTCLELGPGAGTWSKLLVARNPEAQFKLVDISKEMLALAKSALGEKENIDYQEVDFLEYQPEKKYDIFFSSRVIEYIPDKQRVIKNIFESLSDGGRGFIITKTPKYLRAKILRRKIVDFHKNQIVPNGLKKCLLDAGFKDIEIYPVTLSFPVLKSPKLNLWLYKIFGQKKLNCISQFFSESYCVKFRK